MQENDLLPILANRLLSSPVASYFINGAPGSGKTHLIKKISEDLPKWIAPLSVLGPYPVSDIAEFNQMILTELHQMGFMEKNWNDDTASDFYSTWNWINGNAARNLPKHVVVLMELNFDAVKDIDHVVFWFSNIRYLQHFWDGGNTNILFLISGLWNHGGLQKYYNTKQLSFPYTEGVNYLVWKGIGLEDTAKMVEDRFDRPSLSKPFSALVFEITAGHPGAIVDILNVMGKEGLKFASLEIAADKASKEGRYAAKMVDVWRKMPNDVFEIMESLIKMQPLAKTANPESLELMHTAGMIDFSTIFRKRYIKLGSRFTELVIRNNLSQLGIDAIKYTQADFNEFVPVVNSFNVEAYMIINELENLIRNIAVSKMLEEHDDQMHILISHVLKSVTNADGKITTDAYERAIEWKGKNLKAGIDSRFNPLIAYLSTGDLVQLLKEIPDTATRHLQQLANILEAVTPMRDAVMHNQLIEENSLEKLYAFKAEILSMQNRSF